MIIALDTETTGLDFYHGARPFLVTMCADEPIFQGQQQIYWEWDVDPLTRVVKPPEDDLNEIEMWMNKADELILHNAKFDYHALDVVHPDIITQEIWDKTTDTLIGAHLLASNRKKDLTALALQYLNFDILPFEDRLEEATKDIRDRVRREARKNFEFKEWAIADDERDDMPSIGKSGKNKKWKFDTWLPRQWYTVYPDSQNVLGSKRAHPYTTICAEYANLDSSLTLTLGKIFKQEIEKRGYQKHYNIRMKTVRIAFEMEQRGVTINDQVAVDTTNKYTDISRSLGKGCVNIARKFNYTLELPKKGINSSLRTFMLDKLKLPAQYNKKAKSDAPTLDTNAMEHYKHILPSGSDQAEFVGNLLRKSEVDASVSYLAQYQKFWVHTGVENTNEKGEKEYIWRRLHPSFNSTGTDTLRWSSSNPNGQNISKQKDDDGFTLRQCFGPMPDREWWSIDAKNIELRIPFYESGEQSMIDLFERENEPPFYGSNHILIFSVLWEEMWKDAIKRFGVDKAAEFIKSQDGYKSTYYQWTKNGNFAIQYQAGDETADLAYHQRGARKLIKSRFSKLEALNTKYVNQASRFGYVETLPDKSIDPTKGYPLLCRRADWEKVKPTLPLSYHVQGSAMWWTMRAMLEADMILGEWRKNGFDAFMTLQVHDEIVFDMPKREHPKNNPKRSNLGRIREIQRVLETIGNDMGFPQPVSVGYHEHNWGQEIAF